MPLSKRVPSNTSKRDARFRERREATPVSEESKEREESLVKLGPKLTMKFNLSKIKKVSKPSARTDVSLSLLLMPFFFFYTNLSGDAFLGINLCY